jgi:heme/copper-type cytochrome/quinol oxidase subunit 2
MEIDEISQSNGSPEQPIGQLYTIASCKVQNRAKCVGMAPTSQLPPVLNQINHISLVIFIFIIIIIITVIFLNIIFIFKNYI